MTKLTLQEQMLKAGLVSSKKMAKVQRTAKKSRVQAREAREAVEENKKAQLERDKQLSEQQKQAVLAKEYKAQVKQLIEMNRITVARGDIGFNFTDNNLIKKVYVDKVTQSQLIKGRLAMLSHIWLYRSHQARLYGFWRGGLLWLIDLMNSRLRPSIRLD